MDAGVELDGPAVSRVSQADLAKSKARAQLAALKREMGVDKAETPPTSEDPPAADAPAEPDSPDEGPTGRTL